MTHQGRTEVDPGFLTKEGKTRDPSRSLRTARSHSPLAWFRNDTKAKGSETDGRPLRIGVDATCWSIRRGYGRHTRCLLRALLEVDDRNAYLFFTDSEDAAAALPAEKVRVVRSSPRSRSGGRSPLEIARMSAAISTTALDIVFFPATFSYVPVFSGAKKIVTIHDGTAEIFPELVLHNRMARLMWSAKIAIARRQADAFLAVSEYARAQFANHFGLRRELIHVVGEAPDPVFRPLSGPFENDELRKAGFVAHGRAIVYVGGFSPHKNLEVLVGDFARVAARSWFRDLTLYLVGDFEGDSFLSCYQRVVVRVAELGLGDKVVFTGYLQDEALVTLLNLAQVLVLPSMNEGFGLPAVEAAACGCPVIATIASPLPQILGEGALYVDPAKNGEIERALIEVLESKELRERMRSAGLAATMRLSWTGEAQRLLSVFRAVAQQ